MVLPDPVIKNKIKKDRVHIDDPLAVEKVYLSLSDKLKHNHLLISNPIILICIGTDRSTGDCLGPLIGTQLSYKQQNFYHLYGTLDQPVHASNLQEYLDKIHQIYKDPFIIALDACLGSLENVGCISIGDGALKPGAGVNKNLPAVGNIHISGIVNVGGFMEYLVLQNTRLNLVMKMANTVVKALYKIANDYQQNIVRKVN